METKEATAVIDYVQSSSQALSVADKLLAKTAAEKKAASDLAVQVVPLMKELGLIEPSQVKEAEAQLGDHGKAVGILRNVLDAYKQAMKDENAKRASLNLGEGVKDHSQPGKEKQANYVGRRRGDDDAPAPSDRRMLALIGK